jgi:shikimate kinase
MKEGTTLAELYEQRAPLYEKYADITIECDGKTPEECVDLIIK